MSTSRFGARIAPLVAAVVVLSLFAALYPRSPSTAWGALCGGLLVVTAVLAAQYRRGRAEDPFTRQVRGASDERDQRILLGAAACTGWASVLLVGLAMVAVVWHANPLSVLGAMAWAQLLTFVGAHTVLSRRW